MQMSSGASPLVARILDGTGQVDEVAIAKVENELVSQESWRELADVYIRAAEHAPTAEMTCNLWASAGLVYLEKLDDYEAAELWLQRVVVNEPRNLEALLALIRIMRNNERGYQAALLLEQALQIAKPEHQKNLALQLADINENQLQERDRAVAALIAADAMIEDESAELLASARTLLMHDLRLLEAEKVLEEEIRRRLGDRAGDFLEGTEGQLGQEDSLIADMVSIHLELGHPLAAQAIYHDSARRVLGRAKRLGSSEAETLLGQLDALIDTWEETAISARDRGGEARDKAEAALAYMEAAQLYLVYGNDSTHAEEFLDRVKLLKPNDINVLRVFEAVELRNGGHEQAVNRLSTLVDSVIDVSAKVQLLDSMARAAEAQTQVAIKEENEPVILAGFEAWLAALNQAFELNPSNRSIVDRLSSVLVQLDRHEERIDVLKRFADSTDVRDLQIETHLELGRLALSVQHDLQRAQAEFEAVLEIDSHNYEAAFELDVIYSQEGVVSRRRVDVLKILSSYEPEFNCRIARARECQALAMQLSEEEAFEIAVWKFGFAPNLDNQELEHLAECLQKSDELAQVYKDAAQCMPAELAEPLLDRANRLTQIQTPLGDAELPMNIALARRLWFELDQREKASTVLETGLNLGLSHPTGMRQLAKLCQTEISWGELQDILVLHNPDLLLQVGQALHAIYRQDVEPSAAHRDVLTFLVGEGNKLKDGLVFGLELVTLYKELHEPELAFDAALQLYLNYPTDSKLYGVLTSTIATLTKKERVETKLRPLVKANHIDVALRTNLLVALAESYREPQLAIEACKEALELSPGHEAGLELLLSSLIELGHTEELNWLLQCQWEVAPETLKPRVGLLWAGVLEKELNDTTGAIDVYRQVIDLNPHEADALTRLTVLVSPKDAPAEVVAWLKRLGASEPNEAAAAAIEIRIADIYRSHLKNGSGAFVHYKHALKFSSTQPEAILGLESLLDSPELRQLAAAELEPVYKQRGDSSAAIQMLELQLEDTKLSKEEANAVFLRLTDLKAGSGDPAVAFEGLLAAFAHGVTTADQDKVLNQLADGISRRLKLAEVVRNKAYQAQDVDLWRWCARLFSEDETRPMQAQDAWNKVLQHLPSDPEGLEALEHQAALGDEPSQLAQVLEARAKASQDAAESAHYYLKSASIWEEASDLDAALETLNKARLLSGDDRVVWQETARVLGLLGRPAEQVTALREEGLRTEASVAKVQVFLKESNIRKTLKDLEGAVSALKLAYEASPENTEVHRSLETYLSGSACVSAAKILETVYERVEDWSNWSKVSQLLADSTDDPQARTQRWLKIRDIEANKLGQPRSAQRAVEEAYTSAPDQLALLDDLIGFIEQTGQVGRLPELVQAALQQLNGEKLEELVEWAIHRLSNVSLDAQDAVHLWNDLAVHRTNSSVVLNKLAESYEQLGDAQATAKVWAQLAELCSSASEQVAWLLKAAKLVEHSAPDQASQLYTQILDISPASVDGLEGLNRTRWDQPEVVAGALEKAIEIHEGPEKARCLLELGHIFANALSRIDAAMNTYAEVFQVAEAEATHSAAAADALEKLAERCRSHLPNLAAKAARLVVPYLEKEEAFHRLVHAKEIQNESASPAERITLRREIAEIYEVALKQPEMAFLNLGRVFLDDPASKELTSHLHRLALVAQTQEEWAELNADALSRASDPELKVQLLRRIAQINEVHLGQVQDAVDNYEHILELSPFDSESLVALERIYRDEGNYIKLIDLHRKCVGENDLDHTASDPKRRWMEVAELAENELNDPELAEEALGHLRVLEPSDMGVLRRLAGLGERTQRSDITESALKQMLQLTDDADTRAGVLLQLGKLKQEIQDDEGAAAAYLEVLRLRPSDRGAVSGLKLIIDKELSPEKGADVAAVLAPIYLSEDALDAYADCIERVAAGREGPERKVALDQLSTFYQEQLDRPDQAFSAAHRAFREEPFQPESQLRLEELASKHNKQEELVAIYLDEAEATGDPDWVLRRRVAELYEEVLEDQEQALNVYLDISEHRPLDKPIQDAVERLMKQVAPERLVKFYRQQLSRVEVDEERIRIMRALALLQSNVLDDRAGAIATLRRLTEVAPEDLGALEALGGLLEAEARITELSEILERTLETASEPAHVLSLRVKLGRLRAEHFGDVVAADRLLTEVLDTDPRHPEARDYFQERFEDAVVVGDYHLARNTGVVLARALRITEDWPSLVSVLQLRAGMEPRVAERGGLEEEVARIQEVALGQPELAFETLCSTVQSAPGLVHLREQLEGLAERLGRNDELASVYQAAVAQAPDAEVRVWLERRRAHLLEAVQPQAAIEVWQGVLQIQPHDPEALQALDRLYTAGEHWTALVGVLEHLRRQAVSPDSFTLNLRLALIWDESLGEPKEAIKYYRLALAEDESHPEVLAALARLLDPTEAPSELATVLESQVATSRDPKTRLRLRVRLAQLHTDLLNQPNRAIELWQAVLADEPQHPDAPSALEKLYERTERWQDLAAHLQVKMARLADEAEMLRIKRQLGLLKGTKLGKPDEAISTWLEILQNDPNDVEALEALREIHQVAEQWTQLTEVLQKLLPLQANATGVKEIRFALSQVLHEKLDRSNEAIEVAKRVLDLEPHTSDELFRLEHLFTAARADGEAIRVKLMRAEAAESVEARIQILFEVSELYERRKRSAGASAAYAKILELQPDNQKAFESLERIYEANNDHRRLVELYNRKLDVIADIQNKREILFSIISVQERRLGHLDLAFGAACRLCTETGADEEARSVAERLAEEIDGWDVLAEVYETQLDVVGTREALVLHKRLGQIYLHQVKNPSQAEVHLRWALTQSPSDTDARYLLRTLLEDAGRWSDVVQLLSEESELTRDPTVKRHILFEIAQIEEGKAQDPDAAIARVKHALDLDPDDQRALEAMGRLLRKHERWPALTQILERRVEQSTGEERLRFMFEWAEVVEKGLSDSARALELYREVLELDPHHHPSLSALEGLYFQEEKWSDLIKVYEQQAALAPDHEQAVGTLNKIASIWEERFGDLEAAGQTLERALNVNPNDVRTMTRLAQLWRAYDDYPRLLNVLARHVDLAPTTHQAVDLLVEMGEIHLEHTENYDEALKIFHRALQLDPGRQPVIHALSTLYEAREEWAQALDMLRKEVELVRESSPAADLYCRIGELYETRMDDAASARTYYEAALDVDSTHIRALRGQSTILEAEGKFEAVITLRARQAENTRDRYDRTRLYYQVAEMTLEQFEDAERAVAFLEQALDAGPEDVPTLQLLSELYFTEERWKEAEKLLERQANIAETTADGTALGRLYYRLAYIAEKHGQARLALERYHSSYENDSTFLPTLEGLAGALLHAEQWSDAQKIYQAILIQHKSSLTDSEIVDVYYQIGELSLKLDELDRARRAFRRALHLDRSHIPTLGAMAILTERETQWEQAYEYRDRLLQVLFNPEERLVALLEQAKLCEERIREPWRAIDAYVDARKIRPDDRNILEALVRLYRETSQIQRALEVLSHLSVLSTEDLERRDIFIQIADLHIEQQGNISAAVTALNTALDLDPSYIQGFSRIERVLYESRDWAALEENYHRMLKRLPKSQRKARMVLWASLAELYTQVLSNSEGAKIAYEVLHRFDPTNNEVSAQLARLYALDDATKGKAANLYLSLVAQVDDPAVPIRALFNLFFEVGMLDRSFCALGALVLIGAADEIEHRAYAGLLRYLPQALTRRISDSQWRSLIFHPYCRNALAPLMSVVFRGAPSLFAERQRECALRPRRERIDLADTSKNAVARLRYFDVWNRLQRVMNVPPAEHFLRNGALDAPRFLPGETPVLFAGRQNDVVRTASARQTAWVLGRQMALSRPELSLVAALEPEEIAICLEAAIRLYVPEGSGVDLGLNPAEVAQWEKVLAKSLSERAKNALKDPAEAVASQGQLSSLAKYLRGAEYTVNRAALLVSGDIELAGKALDDCEPLMGDVSHRARIRDLMLFVLGADHFELRERLGIKVVPQAEDAVRKGT